MLKKNQNPDLPYKIPQIPDSASCFFNFIDIFILYKGLFLFPSAAGNTQEGDGRKIRSLPGKTEPGKRILPLDKKRQYCYIDTK